MHSSKSKDDWPSGGVLAPTVGIAGIICVTQTQVPYGLSIAQRYSSGNSHSLPHLASTYNGAAGLARALGSHRPPSPEGYSHACTTGTYSQQCTTKARQSCLARRAQLPPSTQPPVPKFPNAGVQETASNFPSAEVHEIVSKYKMQSCRVWCRRCVPAPKHAGYLTGTQTRYLTGRSYHQMLPSKDARPLGPHHRRTNCPCCLEPHQRLSVSLRC